MEPGSDIPVRLAARRRFAIDFAIAFRLAFLDFLVASHCCPFLVYGVLMISYGSSKDQHTCRLPDGRTSRILSPAPRSRIPRGRTSLPVRSGTGARPES